MMDEKKVEEQAVSRSDIEYLQRRLESAYEDRQKIRKMLKIVVAILVDKKLIGEAVAKTFMESKTIKEGKETVKVDGNEEQIFAWFMEAKKLWIKSMKMKKGALRGQLGIKEGETIPPSILQKIVKAEIGTSVSFRGKSLKVTAQLKKRAGLALKFRKMKK